MAAVDADAHSSLASRASVSGFPTIHFVIPGQSPKVYEGERTAKAMAAYALSQMESHVNAQLGSRGGKKNKGKKKSKGSGKKNLVKTLTSASFEEEVLEAGHVVMVEFYAPWCGHCKALEPEYAAAAEALSGEKITLAAVDATVHTDLASEYDIKGFPTILVFGVSDTGEPVPYNGARTAGAIEAYALDLVSSPSVLEELVAPELYQSECDDRKLCFILAVPPVEDTGADGRQIYLDTFRALTAKYAANQFGWLWTSALTHPAMEEALGMGGAGYPAVAVINARKSRMASFRGKLELDSLTYWINRVLRGKEATYPFDLEPTTDIANVEPWDGSGEKVQTTEIDWDDIDIDIEID